MKNYFCFYKKKSYNCLIFPKNKKGVLTKLKKAYE